MKSIGWHVFAAHPKARKTHGPATERGLIEIDLGGGRRVWVDAGVDAKGCVLECSTSWQPMIVFPSGVLVWLATGHTDMRFDGLCLLTRRR